MQQQSERSLFLFGPFSRPKRWHGTFDRDRRSRPGSSRSKGEQNRESFSPFFCCYTGFCVSAKKQFLEEDIWFDTGKFRGANLNYADALMRLPNTAVWCVLCALHCCHAYSQRKNRAKHKIIHRESLKWSIFSCPCTAHTHTVSFSTFRTKTGPLPGRWKQCSFEKGISHAFFLRDDIFFRSVLIY